MRLSDFVCFEALIPQLDSTERDDVIKQLVEALRDAGKVPKSRAAEIIKAVIDRENEASTGIGKGVAVPHVKHGSIKEPVAAVGCCSKGVDFSSLDKQPVYSVLLLLSPEKNPDKHLQAMENLFKNLHNDDFRRFLRQSETVEQIKETILDADEGTTG